MEEENLVALLPFSLEVGILKSTLWSRMKRLQIKPSGSMPSIGTLKHTLLYKRSDLERVAATSPSKRSALVRSVVTPRGKDTSRSQKPTKSDPWGRLERDTWQEDRDADVKLFYDQRKQRNSTLHLSIYN